MKKKATAAALLAVFLSLSMFVGLNAGAQSDQVKWSYLLYLCADNDLDTYVGPGHVSVVEDDFAELMSVGSTKDVACFVLVDRWHGPANLFKVNKGSMEEMTASPLNGKEVNMGDPATLKSFVSFASKKSTAEHTLLIFWDHGSPRGVAWDDHATDAGGEDYLSHWEVVQALSGRNIDVIGADECNVGQIEVAYEYATYLQTKYLVAAETYTGWRGFPYDWTLREMTKSPDMTPREVAVMMIEQTDLLVDAPPSMGERINTHSAVDLCKVKDLVSSLNGLAGLLAADMDSNAAIIAKARGSAQYCYGANAINLVDLRTLVATIGSESSSDIVREACASVLADFDAAVIAIQTTPTLDGMVAGLGIALPDHSWEMSGYYVDYAFASQGWMAFLEAYWAAHGVI